MRAPGRRFVAAVAVAAVAVVGLAACSTDAADQKVIDRLSKLDVMVVPAGATELSRTSVKGGGNIAITGRATWTCEQRHVRTSDRPFRAPARQEGGLRRFVRPTP